MARPNPAQKQLLTLRQAILILAIIVLILFAIQYTRNVMQIRAARAQLTHLEKAVEEVKTKQEDVDEAFIESVSPAQVDEVAKKELGWVLPGDTVYVPLPGGQRDEAAGEDEATTAAATAGGEDADSRPNWMLWWSLVAEPGN